MPANTQFSAAERTRNQCSHRAAHARRRILQSGARQEAKLPSVRLHERHVFRVKLQVAVIAIGERCSVRARRLAVTTLAPHPHEATGHNTTTRRGEHKS